MPRIRLPQFLTRTASPHSTTTTPTHAYEGFTSAGEVVLRDRRADVDLKGAGYCGDDPLAICKPTGSKNVDPAKAMASLPVGRSPR